MSKTQILFILFEWSVVISCWARVLTKIEKANFIIFLVLVLVTILSTSPFFGYYSDKKAWNNGACPKCGRGFWKSFDVDSGNNVGYKCTWCENSHWQNGWYQYKIDRMMAT